VCFKAGVNFCGREVAKAHVKRLDLEELLKVRFRVSQQYVRWKGSRWNMESRLWLCLSLRWTESTSESHHTALLVSIPQREEYVDMEDAHGHTAIHISFQNGHYQVWSVLYMYGTSVVL